MTPRQALAAALTILGRDHVLVAAGGDRTSSGAFEDGSERAA